MKKTKQILTITASVMLIALAAMVAFSVYQAPGGIRVFSVQSGSMEPTIGVGSLVIVQQTDDYQESDVITFRGQNSSAATTTHRIAEVIRDEDLNQTSYRTKGDANQDPDIALVSSPRVLGKVILTIPVIGYIAAFARTQIGFTLLVVVPATLIVYTEAVTIKNEIARLWANRQSTKSKTQKTAIKPTKKSVKKTTTKSAKKTTKPKKKTKKKTKKT